MLRRLFLLVMLAAAALALTGCSTLLQPARIEGQAPTPRVVMEEGGIENPDVYTDPAQFRSALLDALNHRDSARIEGWMGEPFLTGTWRADSSETPPAGALEELYANHLTGVGNPLALVPGADLKALIGGLDPLAIPREEAGVVDAFLVSGWGSDWQDDAVLFVARRPDNSLAWNGWMVVKGGFSALRSGGVEPYQNEAFGISLFLPKGTQIAGQDAENVTFFAPSIPNAGHPGLAYIQVTPAGGRTVQEAVEAEKAELGPGFNISVPAVMGIEDTEAWVVEGLPGQDVNRQVFFVRNNRLYRIVFAPLDPRRGDSYRQALEFYAVITNTLHFLQ